MGLTEGHWFEDEYSLSGRQLERAVEDERAAYERGLRDGKHKLDWINVNDALPEECEDVLVYAEWESAGISGISKGEGIKIGWHIGGRWHIDGKCRVVAKYWMSIPELDIEKEE